MKPIQLILDTSAVAAYPSIHVTEPLAQVAEEDAAFGVPVAALAQAAATTGDHDRIRALIAEPGFVALELTEDRWEQVAVTLGVVVGLACAHAVIVADEVDCEILTATPGLYSGLGDDPPVIPID